jgi:hypothetical protein
MNELDVLLRLKYGYIEEEDYFDRIPEKVINTAYRRIGLEPTASILKKKRMLKSFSRYSIISDRVKRIVEEEVILFMHYSTGIV